MASHRHRHTFILHLIIVYIFYLLSITNAIESQYQLICNGGNQQAVTFNDASTEITLEKVSIPIHRDQTQSDACYLHIFLSNDGSLTFNDSAQCTISFELQETTTPSPTQEPTLNPTVAPTSNTSTPTFNPTFNPTTTPTTTTPTSTTLNTTLNPSSSPSSNPSLSPTSPTSDPTSYPTLEPTVQPTMNPTNDSYAIDLDEIAMGHIFNVNDQNIFWYNYLNESVNSTYYFNVSPNCTSNTAKNITFAEELIDATRKNYTSIHSLTETVEYTKTAYPISSADYSTKPLFPYKFSVTSHDTEMSSWLNISIMNDTTMPIQCYYEDFFETVQDSATDNNSIGIDYYLYPQGQGNNIYREYLIIDIIIKKVCIEDTLSPTPSPTSVADEELSVKLEIIIAIAVVGAILCLASIIVIICLCRRKDIWENNDDGTVELQGPKEHNELTAKHIPFTVTEQDHAEMLELAARNSLSVGLEAD